MHLTRLRITTVARATQQQASSAKAESETGLANGSALRRAQTGSNGGSVGMRDLNLPESRSAAPFPATHQENGHREATVQRPVQRITPVQRDWARRPVQRNWAKREEVPVVTTIESPSAQQARRYAAAGPSSLEAGVQNSGLGSSYSAVEPSNGAAGVPSNGSARPSNGTFGSQNGAAGFSNSTGGLQNGAAMPSNGASGHQNGAMVAGPAVSPSQLPSYVLAELETDAGSREFVMDSDFRWAQDDYNSTQRSIEIWAFIIQLRSRLYLQEQKWSYVGEYTDAKKSARMRTLAKWCLDQVLELGPMFIKLGQLFANRSDILPAEFTEELSKLQDRVPAFDSDKALSIVEQELGAPVDVLYRTFDRRPIAAASLGQVHRATLHTGEQVVVKVQRPGLRKLFDIDLANMKQLAGLLDKTDPNRDTMGIYEESRATLYQEIDYIQEGKHCDRFRRNFKPYPWVRVPVVSWQLTSPNVITLEYLPGIKITDVATLRSSGLNLEEIATRSTESYIIQVLKHGFLHSDPHAGNLAVSPEGQLIYYDFGMMSVIAPATKNRLLDMFYAVYRQDADGVIACLEDLGIIVQTGDSLPLKRTISYFLENINRQAERQETLSAIVDQPFRFPAAFTFVLRAFSTLEGLGKVLIGEEYSFAKVAAPYAQELLDVQMAQTFAITEIGKQAAEMSVATASMPGRIAKIEGVTNALKQGSLKLSVRDPAAQRADRKSSIVQMATFQAVAAVGLLDVGTQTALAGKTQYSTPAFAGALVLCGFIAWGFRRVRKLDKFEKDLKSGKGMMMQQK